ncbi:MAG: DUF402 domain-containing protein, partial [Candidatus Bipolaricaulaceae bacterium]
MGPVKVRVRGIYTTALTALLAERFTIVEPSEVIQARLGIAAVAGPPEVTIQDKPDRQGIVVEGLGSAVEEVVSFLQERIPWAVFARQPVPPRTRRDSPLALAATLLAKVEGEFPKPAKDLLDEIRAKVLFTLPGHHFLKTLAPERVDEAEAKGCPELAQALETELVWTHYAPGKVVALVHMKAGEAPLRQAGELWEVREGRVVVRRVFRAGGLYDGLSLPKCAGDYGYVELCPQRWWSRRTYFRADGELLGEIYNVQTPPEFLPGEIRYLDLEVDLVRVGGEVRLIDEDILKRKVEEGLISPALAERAREEAHRLWAELQ